MSSVTTRTRVESRHALISDEGLVASRLPGLLNASAFFVISPGMGAGFTQLLLRFEARGNAKFAGSELESAFYIHAGKCVAHIGRRSVQMTTGGFGFCPANSDLAFSGADEGTAITCFRRRFQPMADTENPTQVFGNAAEVQARPFRGSEAVTVKILLPDDFRFDMALNVAQYASGAGMPFVETHVMEHGVLFLEGDGTLQLGEKPYATRSGDAAWIAPHCPHHFEAGGAPASYVYYKNVNRPV